MNHPLLHVLLKKYFHGDLTVEELDKLRSLANDVSDDKLRQELDFLWENEKRAGVMDSQLKVELLNSIHNIIDSKRDNTKHSINWWRAAAAVMMPVMLMSLYFAYYSIKDTIHMPQVYAVMAHKGHKSQMLLPDGTQVWLNAGSTVTYNSDFNEKNRDITLNGEAFFDVKKRPHLPFVVKVDSVKVWVLGTAFNVTSYPEEANIRVALQRGKVEIRKENNDYLLTTLIPDEQVTINKKSLQAIVSKCDAHTEGIWHENVLKLSNVSTEEMAVKLERWFGVHITLYNLGGSKKYGLTIKGESLRETLELINTVTPISYKIEGEEVTIRYK